MARVVVTGSNRGLGLGLCTVLADREDDVIAVCRQASPELEKLRVEIVDGVDLATQSATDRLREAVGDRSLDLVVANAVRNRAFAAKTLADLDLELFEDDLAVGLGGAMRTTLALLPNLARGSRVVLVSSGAAKPGPVGDGSLSYKIMKAALNQFARVLAPELAAREIVVAAVCPGVTDTDLLRASYEAGVFTSVSPSAANDPVDSARQLLATAEAASLETSGSFWSSAGDVYTDQYGLAPVDAEAS